MNVILSATTLALTFFLVPETLYERHLQAPTAADDETPTTESSIVKVEATQIERRQVLDETKYRPYTYARSLKIGTYRGGVGKQIITLARPLLLPGVWMIAFWHAGLVGGVVTISTVGPTLAPFLHICGVATSVSSMLARSLVPYWPSYTPMCLLIGSSREQPAATRTVSESRKVDFGQLYLAFSWPPAV